MKTIFVFIAALFCLSSFSYADSPFQNLSSLKNQLGFRKYYSQTPKKRLRIAVLDKGFAGYQNEIGRTLPAATRYVAGPVNPPESMKVEHGLRMAQILTAFMTNDLQAAQWEPELSLYNVFGYTNFQKAIDDVIARKFDIVLYSEVWEYGGNFDGKGFINAQVNRATRAGIIWVNAVGNFGKTTFNGPIKTIAENWVQLPDQNRSLALRCEAQNGKKCPVKIVLSWNDFKEDIELGTDKDLDLALTDDLLNVVQSSALRQTKDTVEQPGTSKYPREIIAAEIAAGTYYIRVKNRSGNFGANDRLRITVDGEFLTMPSYSKDESALNPGDNPNVISVGASDSDRSSRSVKMGKPDILAPSSIKLQNGDEFRGSSNSAAIVAAGVGILKSLKPEFKRGELIARLRSSGGGGGNTGEWSQTGLPLAYLQFGPTGPGCFLPGRLASIPDYIQDPLRRGGVLVQTTAQIRIMTPYDPFLLVPHMRRNRADDMLVISQYGYGLFPRMAPIPPGAVEIFQRPVEAGLCDSGATGRGGFQLP